MGFLLPPPHPRSTGRGANSSDPTTPGRGGKRPRQVNTPRSTLRLITTPLHQTKEGEVGDTLTTPSITTPLPEGMRGLAGISGASGGSGMSTTSSQGPLRKLQRGDLQLRIQMDLEGIGRSPSPRLESRPDQDGYPVGYSGETSSSQEETTPEKGQESNGLDPEGRTPMRPTLVPNGNEWSGWNGDTDTASPARTRDSPSLPEDW